MIWFDWIISVGFFSSKNKFSNENEMSIFLSVRASIRNLFYQRGNWLFVIVNWRQYMKTFKLKCWEPERDWNEKSALKLIINDLKIKAWFVLPIVIRHRYNGFNPLALYYMWSLFQSVENEMFLSHKSLYGRNDWRNVRTIMCHTPMGISQIKCAFHSNIIKSIEGKIVTAFDVYECVYLNVNLFWHTHFTSADVYDVCAWQKDASHIYGILALYRYSIGTLLFYCINKQHTWNYKIPIVTLLLSLNTQTHTHMRALSLYPTHAHMLTYIFTLRTKSPQFGFILADNKHK